MNSKPNLYCTKCSALYHFPIPKNWIEENLLFFIPFKKLSCSKCLKVSYVFITDHEYDKYNRI